MINETASPGTSMPTPDNDILHELDHDYKNLIQLLDLLKKDDREIGINQDKILFFISEPYLTFDNLEYTNSQTYYKDIYDKLNLFLSHLVTLKTISKTKYLLLDSIVYAVLSLSADFYMLGAYKETTELLHLGRKIVQRIRKIKSMKKQARRLQESFLKQADQLFGCVYLKQKNYELALACFLSGLNDLEFFSDLPLCDQLKAELFYRSRLAQTYIELNQICEAETVLQPILKRDLSEMSPNLLIDIADLYNCLGDHYQSNDPLKAIDSYLQTLIVDPQNRKIVSKKINNCYRLGGAKAICDKIRNLPYQTQFISKIDESNCHLGIITLEWDSLIDLSIFSRILQNNSRQSNGTFQISLFLNDNVSPNQILSAIQKIIKNSRQKKRKEERRTKKRVDRQVNTIDSTALKNAFSSDEETVQSTYSTYTQITQYKYKCKKIKKKSQGNSPPKQSFFTPSKKVTQNVQEIIWENIESENLQYPTNPYIYSFGNYWYGYIPPSTLRTTKEKDSLAILSILQHGKISNLGNGIKPAKKETNGLYFFKIKSIKNGLRLYGTKAGYDKTGKYPLIMFNHLRCK